MRPRPLAPPDALQLLQPRPRSVPPAHHFPGPPLVSSSHPGSSAPPSWLPFLVPIVLSASLLFLCLPCLSSPLSLVPLPFTQYPLPTSGLFVFPLSISLSSSPCLSLTLLCGCRSPPPRCPVWPKIKSQGETSKDKQGAVTSLSSLICHFSSSHKGQSQHGLNSGLTGRLRGLHAFAVRPLPQSSPPSFPCRGSGSQFLCSSSGQSSQPTALLLFHLNCGSLPTVSHMVFTSVLPCLSVFLPLLSAPSIPNLLPGLSHLPSS